MELRDEIVESQKARGDLFKWKIILVATLGAIALGFESAADEVKAKTVAPAFAHEYLLCLIPLVCLYVDLLCSHLNLRILVIGRYLRVATRGVDAAEREAEYERFAERARSLTKTQTRRGKELRRQQRQQGGGRSFNAFAFEDLAQHLSSALLSLFVFLWGVPAALASLCSIELPRLLTSGAARDSSGWFFIAAGIAGVALSLLAYWRYGRRLLALSGLAEDFEHQDSVEAAIV